MAREILDAGLVQIPPANPVRARWRYLTETPEPLFAIPLTATTGDAASASILLVATRRHLEEQIGAYYRKLLDSQSVLRLIDENGDQVPVVAHDADARQTGGELAAMELPAPYPPWRVKLLSANATLVDAIIHEQIIVYARLLGCMMALTIIIAAVAGWTLSRRIAFNELGNDALATVAHEMKTPLSSIRLLIETLLAGHYRGGPAQVEEYLHLMAGETERLERLVSGFQMLGRLDHFHGSATGLRLVATPVAEIVESACAQLAPRLQASGCAVQVQVAEPSPVCCADREALTAALVNLLDNAVKYSEPGSHLFVNATEDAERVTLAVRDEGIGIAPDEQGRIFERFYQSDRRLARTHGGCGLGLSIVQSVVRLHAGTISVQSALGHGSTFTISLPRSDATAPVARATRSAWPLRWLPRRRMSA